jgi:hypothetical protein
MPIILILAVLAVLLLSHRAEVGPEVGYGGANQAPPPSFSPGNTPSQNQGIVDAFTARNAPTAPGTFQVYVDGQPTPYRATVSPTGCTSYKVLGKTVYSPAGCNLGGASQPGLVPPPPPPPPRTDGGAPPPPPPYGGNALSGYGHF